MILDNIYYILYFSHFQEPLGAKAPAFPNLAKSSTFVEAQGKDLVLLCQAQAYPVPLFRYLLIEVNFFF